VSVQFPSSWKPPPIGPENVNTVSVELRYAVMLLVPLIAESFRSCGLL
jgi:hypothetical protein